jgi:hypothetical protein
VGSTSTAVTVTVTGCQSLSGLGAAPQAPQQPQAPTTPHQVSTSNSPSTSNGPATLPSASQLESQWTAVAPKGHPTVASTSPSFLVRLVLLLAALLLCGIGATGLVVN